MKTAPEKKIVIHNTPPAASQRGPTRSDIQPKKGCVSAEAQMYMVEINAIWVSLSPRYVSRTGRLLLNTSTIKWLNATEEKSESKSSGMND